MQSKKPYNLVALWRSDLAIGIRLPQDTGPTLGGSRWHSPNVVQETPLGEFSNSVRMGAWIGSSGSTGSQDCSHYQPGSSVQPRHPVAPEGPSPTPNRGTCIGM